MSTKPSYDLKLVIDEPHRLDPVSVIKRSLGEMGVFDLSVMRLVSKEFSESITDEYMLESLELDDDCLIRHSPEILKKVITSWLKYSKVGDDVRDFISLVTQENKDRIMRGDMEVFNRLLNNLDLDVVNLLFPGPWTPEMLRAFYNQRYFWETLSSGTLHEPKRMLLVPELGTSVQSYIWCNFICACGKDTWYLSLVIMLTLLILSLLDMVFIATSRKFSSFMMLASLATLLLRGLIIMIIRKILICRSSPTERIWRDKISIGIMVGILLLMGSAAVIPALSRSH